MPSSDASSGTLAERNAPPRLIRTSGKSRSWRRVDQLAAERHAVGDAARRNTSPGREIREVVRRGVALDGRVGRQDHLLDLAGFEPGLELVEPKLLRTEAVQWRDTAQQHEVQSSEAGGLLEEVVHQQVAPLETLVQILDQPHASRPPHVDRDHRQPRRLPGQCVRR
mgnify:CR=1 FL=1